MKLRRALAAAAATAVIAPAALLAAPAAYATEGQPETGASQNDPADNPPPVENPPADKPPAENPPPVENPPAENPPADKPPAVENPPADNPPAAENPPAENPPADKPPADEEEKEEEVSFECSAEEEAQVNEDLKTSLVGLPDTVVAGTGWKNFEFQLHNGGDSAIEGISPYVTAFSADEDDVYFDGFTLEVYKAESGAWEVVADELGAGGYFEPVTLKAGEKRTLKLRLKVDGSVPASVGIAIGAGEYSTEDGCWISDDSEGWLYYFDIVEKGSPAPEKPGESQPKPQTGGVKPVSADKVTKIETAGQLAETGSSSALPMFALAGSAAVALGAGAMFVVRRRKGAGTGTSSAA